MYICTSTCPPSFIHSVTIVEDYLLDNITFLTLWLTKNVWVMPYEFHPES